MRVLDEVEVKDTRPPCLGRARRVVPGDLRGFRVKPVATAASTSLDLAKLLPRSHDATAIIGEGIVSYCQSNYLIRNSRTYLLTSLQPVRPVSW